MFYPSPSTYHGACGGLKAFGKHLPFTPRLTMTTRIHGYHVVRHAQASVMQVHITHDTTPRREHVHEAIRGKLCATNDLQCQHLGSASLETQQHKRRQGKGPLSEQQVRYVRK